ncbi:hypothetical protein [Maribacter sp. R77961]|jgi:hypothetical protein
MSAARNNSKKRKYRYPTRPFYWSLHAKPRNTIVEQEKPEDEIVLHKKVV